MKRIALVAVAVFLLASCSLLDSKESESPSASAPPIIDEGPVVSGPPEDPFSSPVYSQEIAWRDCGDLECATVEVPLDWSMPDGATISIAINRLAAKDQDARLGSLLLNPGGPGGSGIELLEYFEPSAGEKMRASYDLIGFDPRGVGDSAPVDCGDGKALDAYYVADFSVQEQADLEEATRRNQEFAANCRALSGRVLENVDTVSAARDMDVIRAVLGDEKLNFLGFSYGTQLGATYAEIYPQNVGRIVLDGAVDFSLPSIEQSLTQAAGFENALTNFITWCFDQSDCPLTGDIEQARHQIAQIATTARDETYTSDGNTPVNGNLMVYGIVVTLYDQESWVYLKEALAEVIEEGVAPFFYALGNFYLDRDGSSSEYLGNSTVAFTAIGCLDAGDEPWTIQDQRDFAKRIDEVAPTFGWWFSGSVGCEGWPYVADETVTVIDKAKSAAPMLVIGTTNDPATPYEWAVSLSEQLGATLLTFEGEGHTAYGRSNQCITDAVDGFFVDGVMPPAGLTC